MIQKSLFFLFFSLFLSACQWFKTQKETENYPLSQGNAPESSHFINEIDESPFKYALKGKTATDFIQDPHFYSIQYEAMGDLNRDGLMDKVLVVKHKKNRTAARYILILLQDGTQNFHLNTLSNTIFEPEYNEYDYKWYETEEIAINNGTLQISFYGNGASGNIFYQFEYQNEALLLSYLEVFGAGAGEQSTEYYDFKKGEITKISVNMMEEEMPETITSRPLTQKVYPFSKTSYTLVMQENE